MSLEALSSLYPKATRSKNEVERLLEKFELGLDRSIALQQRLSAVLNDFCRQVTEINSLLQTLKSTGSIDKSQEKIWNRRVDNLVLDSDSLRDSISKQLDHIYKTKNVEKEKQSLGDRSSNNLIRSLVRERTIWQESHMAIDHALEQAKGIVNNLRNQNRVLKSIRRRALDIASKMGVSHTLLYTIERRNLLDQALVYVCIFITSAVFICTYILVHYVYKK